MYIGHRADKLLPRGKNNTSTWIISLNAKARPASCVNLAGDTEVASG